MIDKEITVLSDYSVDVVGPTRKIISGDTPVDGDGNSLDKNWITLLDDTFNQSRNAAALVSAGYAIHDGSTDGPVGSTIVENGNDLTITSPINCDWWGGNYTGARLSYALPIREDFPSGEDILVLSSHTNNNVADHYNTLLITEGENANFLALDRAVTGGAQKIGSTCGPATILTAHSAVGAITGWGCFWIDKSRHVWFGFTNTAWGSVPVMSDIVWHHLGYSAINWGPGNLIVHLLNKRVAGVVDSVQKFGRLIIKTRGK